MANQDHIKNWLVRKLTKVGGNSYAVTLPITTVRRFGWREHQKLQVTIDEAGKRIIISDWQD